MSAPNPFQGQQYGAPQGQPNQSQPQPNQFQGNPFQSQPQPNQFQGQPQAPQGQPVQQTAPQQTAPAAPQHQQQQFAGGNAPAGNLAEMFNQGTTGGGDKLFEQANLGRAVIVRPLSYEAAVPTSKGSTDAVRAEWIFLDEFQQTRQAVTYTGLIFQKVPKQSLHGALQSPQPKPTLGVIAMGEGRNGNNAPWLLNPTEEHTNTAMQAVNAAGWM